MKTKRAKNLLASTSFTESTHPAICALVDFAAQNPGLDPLNYVTMHSYDSEGWSAYRSEARSIQKDWQRFKLALCEASSLGVTDAQVIEAAKGAFSGRLEWTGQKVPACKSGSDILACVAHDHASEIAVWISRKNTWLYCTGQYFPTEYRKAAASVLEGAIHALKANRPAVSREVFSIAALRELNEENGGLWFEKGNMRFFGTRIESGILTGHFFITSEQPPHGRRAYTVRTFDEKGSIGTHGQLCGYATKAQALKAAQAAHVEKVQVAA